MYFIHKLYNSLTKMKKQVLNSIKSLHFQCLTCNSLVKSINRSKSSCAIPLETTRMYAYMYMIDRRRKRPSAYSNRYTGFLKLTDLLFHTSHVKLQANKCVNSFKRTSHVLHSCIICCLHLRTT